MKQGHVEWTSGLGCV